MYQRGAKGWAKHMDFVFLDMACMEAALFLAYFSRHGNVLGFFQGVYLNILIVSLFIGFFFCVFFGMMKNVLRRGYWQEFRVTLNHVVLVFFGMAAYMFTLKVGEEYSRITIYLMIPIYGVLSYLTRILWKQYLCKRLKKTGRRSLLILTNEEAAEGVLNSLGENNYARYQVQGIVVPEQVQIGKKIQDVEVVANYDTVIEYANSHWVDEVMIFHKASQGLPEELLDTFISMGITVHVALEKPEMGLGVKQVFSNIGGILVITNTMNYMTPRQSIMKRALDICGGLVGCVITGVLYVFLAPIIKINSPGPAFFSQTRVGQNGKKFQFYKFRSMYLDAEERKKELMEQNRVKDGMMFKMDFDPRIIGNHIDEKGNQRTGIGEFIRKTSLDEFPQFWNVLKGDMSLVGTRPPTVDEYEKYDSHHKARLAAKPGITGLWQVSGRSNIMDFEEVVKLDTEYINNWSVGMDIKILLRTVLVVLKKEGSM